MSTKGSEAQKARWAKIPLDERRELLRPALSTPRGRRKVRSLPDGSCYVPLDRVLRSLGTDPETVTAAWVGWTGQTLSLVFTRKTA